MAKDRPGMTPRWARHDPRRPQDARDNPGWTQDGPKMAPRQPQSDPKMVLPCKRSAIFGKSAIPSNIHTPRKQKVALRRLKQAQDEQDGLKRAQDGPKMASGWPQAGAKMESRWQQNRPQVPEAMQRNIIFSRIAQNRQNWRLV